MNKSEAKRKAWAKAAIILEDMAEDPEMALNPHKYSRHDQIRFEEAVEDIIDEMKRRSVRKKSTRRDTRRRDTDRDRDRDRDRADERHPDDYDDED